MSYHQALPRLLQNECSEQGCRHCHQHRTPCKSKEDNQTLTSARPPFRNDSWNPSSKFLDGTGSGYQILLTRPAHHLVSISHALQGTVAQRIQVTPQGGPPRHYGPCTAFCAKPARKSLVVTLQDGHQCRPRPDVAVTRDPQDTWEEAHHVYKVNRC